MIIAYNNRRLVAALAIAVARANDQLAADMIGLQATFDRRQEAADILPALTQEIEKQKASLERSHDRWSLLSREQREMERFFQYLHSQVPAWAHPFIEVEQMAITGQWYAVARSSPTMTERLTDRQLSFCVAIHEQDTGKSCPAYAFSTPTGETFLTFEEAILAQHHKMDVSKGRVA